ncbi:hypothetical protein B0H13DRAFT_2550968 [Mycena leptocephala]|nr:hypothetical protein B0H13DRAFT_2550968 [Mycena leptocephala]
MEESIPDSKLPPFAMRDILESNDPLLESGQIPFLRDFVSKGRARLSALNAKIASLQFALDELVQESHALDIEIRKHEGGLSALRRMPTEILSLIFTFTLPPHVSGGGGGLSEPPAPWTVSAVCARWRAIVISQPCFWASINLSFTNSSRLETQLQRSGEFPLTVDFDTEDFTSEDLHLLRILSKHARRWETMSISGPNGLFSELQDSIEDQLSLLRELSITMVYEEDDTDIVPSLSMFEDAPQLQRVSVNKILWALPVAMALSWSHLLYYGGTNTWTGHLYSLRSATNLVDCSLEIQKISALPQTLILLPSLRRLSLSNPAFLQCLETPTLLELYCDYAPHCLSFLRRQPCKLQKLVLWDSLTPVDRPDLTHIVNTVPTITNLDLMLPLPATFARDLCSNSSMAPALRHISTVLLKNPPSFQNLFMQAIESRWQGGRLKSVKVQSLEFAPGIVDRMELLKSQGMEFVVFPSPYSLLQDVVPSELRIETEE